MNHARPLTLPALARGLAMATITAVAIAASGPSFSQPAEPAATVFIDPGERYTVPIPTNWTAAQVDADWAALWAPGETLRVDVVVIGPSESLLAAAEAALALVDPTIEAEVDETIALPAGIFAGTDEVLVVAYDLGTDEEILQAEVRRVGDSHFVLVFRGDLVAVQQRTAQIQLIDTGFRIGPDEETVARAEPLPLSDDLLAALEIYVEEKLAQLDVPGATIAIVANGEIAYARGFGVADLETGVPMTPATMMMIGSTTKSMTTLMMAQLVDEGVFAWDTPVQSILPSFAVVDPELSRTLTMRDLVCGCTGMPRRDAEWVLNASSLTAEGMIASLATFDFFTAPGEAFQYSNQMVAAAGYIATLAAGGTLGELGPDYLQLFDERILTPLGMQRSTFSFAEIAAADNVASPYYINLDNEVALLPLETEQALLSVAPAGALWSNVEELASFMLVGLNHGIGPDGQRIVSEANLEFTWQPQVDIAAGASYGLGWIIEDFHGHRVVSHAGNTFGFTSELALLPESGIGIAILANQQGSLLNTAVRARLLDLLFEVDSGFDNLLAFQLGMVDEAVAEMKAQIAPETDLAAVGPFVGTYTHAAVGDVALTIVDGGLWFDAGEVAGRLLPLVDPDDGEVQYLTDSPAMAGLPLILELDDAGEPVIRVGAGVAEYILTRVP